MSHEPHQQSSAAEPQASKTSSSHLEPHRKHPPERRERAHTTTAAATKQQIVSRRARITGGAGGHTITVGHGTVIHPMAVIVARDGPITIGDYCIVDEFCEIANELGDGPSSSPPVMAIGHCNHFSSRAEIRALKIGDQNKMMPYASVGIGAVVGNNCRVEPYCRVSHDVVVPSETVVFGAASLWAKREHFLAQEEKDEMICLTRALRSTMKE
jgi:carbonic anhydrase/acetyltransferase-like protein (isoleucine patch superfamily)